MTSMTDSSPDTGPEPDNEADSLLERLRNPLWVHGDAPFESPQLDKEQTVADLAEAAWMIDALCNALEVERKSGPAQLPDREALTDLLETAKILLNSCEENYVKHHTSYFREYGLPPSLQASHSIIRRAEAALAPGNAGAVEATKAEFAEWSRVWNNTCNTMLEMLGLPGHGSPGEMIAQLQAYLEGRAAPLPATQGDGE